MSRAQRTRVVGAGCVQLALAGSAWWDLARRPESEVNGTKRLWAFVIAINFAGPLAYFRWGRITSHRAGR
ncbi:PLDc N-terminal domain-containing protein [Amycolatopsis sp. CA-230715]|uniref:PLDc N-terminal domain-containing protein n=1 Tax=Amycolatopsis sp. CA-230715 TaxID=2745196 RepID=UPI001C329287|nr:PLDc N-terminal domain-containing protein [Amycolatopsis sp. CA-230715]QWF78004.1 hypothetical protein HUW46_01397 [Amycolatopsis sp. CA-230715]